MIFNWFQSRSMTWSIPVQYSCTLFFLLSLLAVWWFTSFKHTFYRVRSLEASYAEIETNQRAITSLTGDVENIKNTLSTIKKEPESSMTVFSWVMNTITEASLKLITCTTQRPAQAGSRLVCVEFILQGDFESFLSFLKTLEKGWHGILVQQCTLTRQSDTLLDGKILIVYSMRELDEQRVEDS